MAWFLRHSKHGIHAVYGQQASHSCGIACVLMVNFKLKKWNVPAITDAVRSETDVYDAYSKVTGRKYNGTKDTDAFQLMKVLNQLQIGSWNVELVPRNRMADRMLDNYFHGYPFIVLVHWRDSVGHFVVCDNVVRDGTGGSADICDPWDAAVRTIPLQRGQLLGYSVSDQPGIDFGQKHNTYSQSATADADGWVLSRL